MTQHTFNNSSYLMDTGADVHQQSRDGLMGVMLALSLASFAVAFGWIVSDFSNPFFQLGLLLLTFLLVSATGILYFLNPARFLTFFLIGLVYFSFEATFRPGGGGGDLQSMVKGIFTMALALLGLFTGMRYVFKSALALVFFSYAAFALASASYSPLLMVGSVAGVALIGVAIMAAKVGGGDERDVAGYWVAMYWASVLTALASLAVLAIAPTMARDLADPSKYRLRGITGTANSLGPLMAAGCMIALFMLKRAATTWKWRFHAFMLLVFFATLLLTNSRSSIMGLVAAMFGSWLVAGQLGVLGLLVGLLGLAVLAIVMLYPGLQDALLSLLAGLFARSGNVAELTTFTGRQQIWDASWRLAHEAPWIGHGLSSVSVVLPKAHADEWGNTVATAHNFFLESLISVGWLGTGLLLAVVLMALWILARFLLSNKSCAPAATQSRDLAVCAFRCMIMMLVQGFGEKAFAGHPGSPFLALGAVVATSIFIAREYLASDLTRVQATP